MCMITDSRERRWYRYGRKRKRGTFAMGNLVSYAVAYVQVYNVDTTFSQNGKWRKWKYWKEHGRDTDCQSLRIAVRHIQCIKLGPNRMFKAFRFMTKTNVYILKSAVIPKRDQKRGKNRFFTIIPFIPVIPVILVSAGLKKAKAGVLRQWNLPGVEVSMKKVWKSTSVSILRRYLND